MVRRRRRGTGLPRCRYDRKTTFRTFEQAAAAAARLGDSSPYWCPVAGGYHIRRGDQADYDRRQATYQATEVA